MDFCQNPSAFKNVVDHGGLCCLASGSLFNSQHILKGVIISVLYVVFCELKGSIIA